MASEVIRVGILGAGSIAGTMATTIRLMNEGGEHCAELYAVASRSQEKADAFAAEYAVPKAFGSYEAMLADDNIDLVYIATPHSEHYRCAMMCIDAGKAVLCEKAFTVNALQAVKLCAHAEEKKILLTEAIWTRYMPMRQIINDAVRSGKVGTPQTITANLSYKISQNRRMTDPMLAGGSLLDVGVYTLNFAEMIFGRADSVNARCTYTSTGVDETDSVFLTWKDGKTAHLTAGMKARGDRKGIIYCTDGYIIVENINNPQSVAIFDDNDQLIEKTNCPAQFTGYEYEVIEAADALRKGLTECKSMPHDESIHMMELMDHIRAQLGVKYPFEKEIRWAE